MILNWQSSVLPQTNNEMHCEDSPHLCALYFGSESILTRRFDWSAFLRASETVQTKRLDENLYGVALNERS
jgi:hypothetical protein